MTLWCNLRWGTFGSILNISISVECIIHFTHSISIMPPVNSPPNYLTNLVLTSSALFSLSALVFHRPHAVVYLFFSSPVLSFSARSYYISAKQASSISLSHLMISAFYKLFICYLRNGLFFV